MASIVEGDGEVEALPVLIRIWFPHAVLLKPIRVPRDRFIRDHDDQARFVQLARHQGANRLLILLDAHEDCPVDLARALLPPAEAAFQGTVAVVLAVREYETWFLQCLPEFASERTRQDPEAVRGAKERIRAVRGRYSPTADQAALSRDLAVATAMSGGDGLPRSLSKLYRTLKELLVSVD